MPATTTEDEVPPLSGAAAMSPIKGEQAFSFAGVLFGARYHDDNEEEEGDEEEDKDYESALGSHDWRDDFESVFPWFSAPPLPSSTLCASNTRTLLQPSSTSHARTRQQKQQKQTVGRGT